MCAFTYRRELKGPGKWMEIDFSAPGIAPALRMMVQTLRRQSRDFAPPSGVTMERIAIPLRDGQSMDCFVFRPGEVAETLPAMLYCHGGGFFLPVQPMMMQLSAQYAQTVKIKVFLPEYRFLPEYPAPVPLYDCQDAWCFLEKNAKELGIHSEKILLYGESAGGTLAAGLALWARERKGNVPLGQALIYPALDNQFGRYPSVRMYSQAAWTLKNNLVMWREYLKCSPKANETLVPMRAENLSGLPTSYVEPQQMDILHDEAIAYAGRLEQDGVPVSVNDIAGSYHGFDADTKNPFVQSVVRRRMEWMSDLFWEEKGKGLMI